MERELRPATPWTLTDEEWCELCFKMIELAEQQQQLQALLLGEERPSLNQLWVAASAYQRQSNELFAYLAQQLRERAAQGERRAA